MATFTCSSSRCQDRHWLCGSETAKLPLRECRALESQWAGVHWHAGHMGNACCSSLAPAAAGSDYAHVGSKFCFCCFEFSHTQICSGLPPDSTPVGSPRHHMGFWGWNPGWLRAKQGPSHYNILLVPCTALWTLELGWFPYCEHQIPPIPEPVKDKWECSKIWL